MPVLPPGEAIVPFAGSRFVPLASPSRGSTRTAVWQIDIEPGGPAVPHQLTAEEIFVVLEGSAHVALAGATTAASPGDTIVVPPDTDFAIGSTGPGSLRLLCVFPVGGQARTPDGQVFTPPWAL